MLVKRRTPDVGALDDIAHGETVVSAFEQKIAQCVEQRLPRPLYSPVWFGHVGQRTSPFRTFRRACPEPERRLCYNSSVEQTQSPSPLARLPDGAPAGIVIAIASLMTLVSVAHHPTTPKALKPADAFPAIVALTGADRMVHTIVIGTMLALVFGFTVYALRRGLHRSAVIGGLIAFTFGIATTIGAALVDGFLIPEIASRYVDATPELIGRAAMLLQTCALAIQVATKAGFVGMSLGIVLWSADLIFDKGFLRIAGIVGVLAGVVPVILTLSGGYLNPHALMVVIAIQTLWYLAIATLLLQRRA